MSTLDEKLARAPEAGGPARRTYRSLEEVRGGARREADVEGRAVVSICPMEGRSFWQHDGHGKWNAVAANYSKLEREET